LPRLSRKAGVPANPPRSGVSGNLGDELHGSGDHSGQPGSFASQSKYDEWLEGLGVERAKASDLGGEALAAYLHFGRGFHPARLNLGDCFAYALAKRLDAPLLFKGNGFSQTDVRSAVQPT
jgi:uncharacterized protein with PIN domain